MTIPHFVLMLFPCCHAPEGTFTGNFSCVSCSTLSLAEVLPPYPHLSPLRLFDLFWGLDRFLAFPAYDGARYCFCVPAEESWKSRPSCFFCPTSSAAPFSVSEVLCSHFCWSSSRDRLDLSEGLRLTPLELLRRELSDLTVHFLIFYPLLTFLTRAALPRAQKSSCPMPSLS